MDNLTYLNLLSQFMNEDNNIINYINNIIHDNFNIESNTDVLIEKSINYFEVQQNIYSILPNNPDDTIEKLFKYYIEAKLGIMAIQFDKLKKNKCHIYKNVVDNLKNNGYEQIEEVLKNHHEKLLENYTPLDIHILSGGTENDYMGWY